MVVVAPVNLLLLLFLLHLPLPGCTPASSSSSSLPVAVRVDGVQHILDLPSESYAAAFDAADRFCARFLVAQRQDCARTIIVEHCKNMSSSSSSSSSPHYCLPFFQLEMHDPGGQALKLT